MRRPRGGITMNDRERELWVMNSEGAYRAWRASRQSMRTYIRENRAALTDWIRRELGEPPLR